MVQSATCRAGSVRGLTPGARGWLVLTVLLVVCPWVATAAPPKRSSPAGKDSGESGESTPLVPMAELPTLGFSAIEPLEGANAQLDRDETPDGIQRLREVEGRAREIFRERDAVERERRPMAGPRDVLVGQVQQAQAANAELTKNLSVLDRQLTALNRKTTIANGPDLANLRSQIRGLQSQAAAISQQIGLNNAGIARVLPQIQALNLQLAPLDARLEKLWNELNEARKQWLVLRQPVDKYARGEFEMLRRVLDDWLLIDGLWPGAFAWAALCSYELHDYEKAAEYLGKAQDIRVNIVRAVKPWAQLEALTGLIGYKTPQQSSKANTAIQTALRVVDKNADWETYYVIGRCYVDREKDVLRAKANLEKALKIKPSCHCAKLWLARLQTTTPAANVRDVPAGTKALEALWSSTGQRSWRMGLFLLEAYLASQRTDDANQLLTVVQNLVPDNQRAQLAEDLQKARQRVAMSP